ncbi:hypothetical protein [Actinoallomurus iriomotensis]|uniref:Uncharacterized protein n=1 Tax=Actinoallomurus iriomotensis TaxID=478107 RepID=A0A9W6RQN9_9ACTN|nr:hypothetical protein [Actinoallomurus iriomotensis]GLY78402.1 hypothetical protein Airi01_066690 [Actinoallomurus iriomotensis]
MSILEDRYRRLLSWYPADHRREHEQEMLGVLLAGARPGQTRPSAADVYDLLRGAVRIHLRRAVGGSTTPGWAAATAIAGFVATLLLVAEGLRFAVNTPQAVSQFIEARAHRPFSLPHMLVQSFGTAPYWAVWLVIAVLAWRGARRPAACAASVLTGAQLLLVVYGTATTLWGAIFTETLVTTSLPLSLVATASLLASPGPRHGAELLGRRAVLGAAAAAAVLIALTTAPLSALFVPWPHTAPDARQADQRLQAFKHSSHVWNTLQLAALLTAFILLLVVLARTREGRRACALLAIPATPLITEWSELVGNGFLTDGPHLARLLLGGLAGFTVVMLGVRLAELSSERRTGDREQRPA